jgi:hypothetical protein
MRFNLGDVWKSPTGLRAAVIHVGDDGRTGLLLFEDGSERELKWMELAQVGYCHIDRSPKPSKSAAELEQLVFAKIAQHPVCPPGMTARIRGEENGKMENGYGAA